MLAKKEKAKVFVLYMANGRTRQFMNQFCRAPVAERLLEAEKASKYGNFEYVIALNKDEIMRLDSLPQKDLIEVIEDISKAFQPDIVVIPYRDSFSQDHRAVAQACITAFRPLPKSLRWQPEMILEMEEPYSWPSSFTPNFYVDISNVIEEKIELYKCHASQVPEDPFPRSINNLRRLAGMRGCDISVKYAEGYRLLRGQL